MLNPSGRNPESFGNRGCCILWERGILNPLETGDPVSFGNRGCCIHKTLLQRLEFCVPAASKAAGAQQAATRLHLLQSSLRLSPLTLPPRGSSGLEMPPCHLPRPPELGTAVLHRAVPTGAPQIGLWHPQELLGAALALLQPSWAPPDSPSSFSPSPIPHSASAAELLSPCCCCFGLLLQGSGAQNHAGLGEQGTQLPCIPAWPLPCCQDCFVQE